MILLTSSLSKALCHIAFSTFRILPLKGRDVYKRQIEGGTHEAGFRSALTRVLKKYAEDTKALEKAKVEISGEDFREGAAFGQRLRS